MNVFFQEVGTEDVLFNPREELLYIPNVGEDVYIEGTWYTVVERNLYLKHLDIIDDNSITLWMKKLDPQQSPPPQK